jgi:hypothetical protein
MDTLLDGSCGIFITEKIKSGESTIKHIVMAGGGPNGFTYYGAVRELAIKKYWNIENIQTVCSTSVGSLFAVVITLGYDWTDIDEYFIKRPWQNVFKMDMFSLFESVQKMGLFTIKNVEDTIAPLLAGKDISIDVTMRELYEITKIETHIYITELNTFRLIDVSYKTHPDWRVVDAIYCSSSLPIIFLPVIKDGQIYCDGGFLSNYPIRQCIENGADPDEILGAYGVPVSESGEAVTLSKESNLFDYLMVMLNKIIDQIFNIPNHVEIGIECAIPATSLSISNIYNSVNSQEERKRLIDAGANLVDNM